MAGVEPAALTVYLTAVVPAPLSMPKVQSLEVSAASTARDRPVMVHWAALAAMESGWARAAAAEKAMTERRAEICIF